MGKTHTVPPSGQGYKLTHVLLFLIARRGRVRARVLRRVFGDRVYPYLHYLERQGVVRISEDGIVYVNTSFLDTIRLYEREIEKAIKAK